MDTDGGALAGVGLEEEAASEQFGAFAHAEEPEVSVGLCFGDAIAVERATVVADLEDDVSIVACEADPSVFGSGVFLDILQGLLGEAEEVGEVVGGEEVDGDGFEINIEVQAGALAECVGVFFQRGGEAEMIEQGRAKFAGEGAHIGQRGGELVAQVEQFLAEPSGNFSFLGQADADGGGGEDLRDVVVKFAADALLLLFFRLEELLGEGLQFVEVRFRGGGGSIFTALEDARARGVLGRRLGRIFLPVPALIVGPATVGFAAR